MPIFGKTEKFKRENEKKRAAELYGTGDYTQKEIAKKMRRSEAWVMMAVRQYKKKKKK